MKLQEKLHILQSQKKAILAANFYNLETLMAVIKGASEENEPVILQLSESSIHYMGLQIAAQMAKTALMVSGVEGWLHLDHANNIELVSRCLEEGFDSVMIDASELPLEENIRITHEVVTLARKYGANVEAELGYVAKPDQVQDASGFTQPEEAKFFVDKTGIDALAVSIGSAHGFYKEEPNLDLTLLAKIKNTVDIPLVLHGSSGIPDSMLQKAIEKGITKINLATETKNTFMSKLREELCQSSNIDLRQVFPKAIGSAQQLIQQKLRIISKA
jgi:fructose-bisphosphate aldolase class II/tagatose 1,6-diphosphate aldolase GatY/KbaY